MMTIFFILHEHILLLVLTGSLSCKHMGQPVYGHETFYHSTKLEIVFMIVTAGLDFTISHITNIIQLKLQSGMALAILFFSPFFPTKI